VRNLFKSSLSHFDAVNLERLHETALLLVDESLCIIHANEHAERLLVVPALRLEGKPVGQLFRDDRAVDALLQGLYATHDAPSTLLPPTYLLRKAVRRDERRLWQVHVHLLNDERFGPLLLLLLKDTPRHHLRRPPLVPRVEVL
jgi:hypothetical protein